jgi:transcriptional regulator with XRE-family HTH domain
MASVTDRHNRRVQSPDFQDAFRGVLKHYRKTLGIHQSELAKEAGIGQPTLSNFENGKWHLSAKAIGRLQQALLKLVGDRAAAVGFFIKNPLQIRRFDSQHPTSGPLREP